MRNNQVLGLMYEMAVFVQVIKSGSFSQAAKDMGCSPSSISRCINKLEQEIGVCLLRRTTRKIKLSEQGIEIYKRCLELDNAAREVLSATGELANTANGLIRIAAPKAIAFSLLHPHLPAFLNQYPDIDIQLLLDDVELDLIDNNIDVLFRITNTPPPGLMGKKLFPIKHILGATPEYIEQFGAPTHPSELQDHSCIYLGENTSDSRWRFVKGSKNITVQVHGRYSANHTRVRLDAVKSHLGIGSLPYFTAEKSLLDGSIVQVLPDWYFQTGYCGDLWMLYTPTKYIPSKIKLLCEHVIESLQEKIVNYQEIGE